LRDVPAGQRDSHLRLLPHRRVDRNATRLNSVHTWPSRPVQPPEPTVARPADKPAALHALHITPTYNCESGRVWWREGAVRMSGPHMQLHTWVRDRKVDPVLGSEPNRPVEVRVLIDVEHAPNLIMSAAPTEPGLARLGPLRCDRPLDELQRWAAVWV